MDEIERAKKVLKILNKTYPEIAVPLKSRNVFTLLISVLLSVDDTFSKVALIKLFFLTSVLLKTIPWSSFAGTILMLTFFPLWIPVPRHKMVLLIVF